MGKMYIEMNDSERLLKRIYNDADWAFSMLSEGIEHLMDESVEGTTVEEVNRLQNKATHSLINFETSINALMALLKPEDEQKNMRVVLNNIGFDKDELEDIKGCCVCGITDGVDDEGTEFVLLSFYNPATKKYIQLQFNESGEAFITAPFGEGE